MRRHTTGNVSSKNKEIGQNSSKVHINDSNDDFFLLEHDSDYVLGSCFHMTISWIFAPGPKMLEMVVKPLFRCIREFDGGCFKALPISARLKDSLLVPF